ncbi:MAG: VOC family protein [Mariprofundaceae bacterium]|nr:VOC family protein [Mariprofundaceae bacterium]
MNEITAIDHIGIRVFNLDLARAFYEKLGFIFITGPVGSEPVAIMRHPCGIVINFILNAVESPHKNILMDIDEKHAGYTHIALHVTDLNAIQSTLNTLDIAITENKGENFGSSLFIRDQDNNVIEFHQNA